MSASSEPQFRSLDLAGRNVTRAWMAATISAGLTLIFGALAAAGVLTVPGADGWILVDAALLGGLAYGVWRHSRVCALLLLIYSVVGETYLAFEGTARFSLLRIIFIYFYFRGTIELFKEQRNAATPMKD
jgi:serine/threonine-protein kinase